MPQKVTVKHFHEGNDPGRAWRKGRPYATRAALVDLDTGEVKAEEWGYCSRKDSPRRSVGREVAIGRLISHHGGLFDDPETVRQAERLIRGNIP